VVVQAHVATNDGSNLKGNAAKAFDSFKLALAEHNTVKSRPDGSHGFPDWPNRGFPRQWQDQFYADAKAKEKDVTEDTLSKRFRRAIGELVKSQQIGTLGQRFWLDSRTTLDMSGH
jgi:hypothetical protein